MSSNWINQSTDTERILQELVEISQNPTSDNVVRYRMLQEELLRRPALLLLYQQRLQHQRR